MDTLVLNKFYQPVDQVSWQDAMTALVSGRAMVVAEYEDRTVKTPRIELKVPSIIRFMGATYNAFNITVKFNRNNVYHRDQGKCQYCGEKVSRSTFTYDHVVPRALGGRTYWTNIVVSCSPCNGKKRNRTPAQAGMKLLSKPVRPKHLSGVSTPVATWKVGMPSEWRDFLKSAGYWHGELDQT